MGICCWPVKPSGITSWKALLTSPSQRGADAHHREADRGAHARLGQRAPDVLQVPADRLTRVPLARVAAGRVLALDHRLEDLVVGWLDADLNLRLVRALLLRPRLLAAQQVLRQGEHVVSSVALDALIPEDSVDVRVLGVTGSRVLEQPADVLGRDATLLERGPHLSRVGRPALHAKVLLRLLELLLEE